MKRPKPPKRLVVDVPAGTEDLVIVHPSGRVHRFNYEHLLDDPNEDPRDATEDASHRIQYPIPFIRKVLRLKPPANIKTLELLDEHGESIHVEEIGSKGSLVTVEVPEEVTEVRLELPGEDRGWPRVRFINLEEDKGTPDLYGLHGFTSLVDIPNDVDIVRIDNDTRPDDTFKVVHYVNPDAPKEEEDGGADNVPGVIELVISKLAGGQAYYTLEFAHPDGVHYTVIDEDEDPVTRTYERTAERDEAPVEECWKPSRTTVTRKKAPTPRRQRR